MDVQISDVRIREDYLAPHPFSRSFFFWQIHGFHDQRRGRIDIIFRARFRLFDEGVQFVSKTSIPPFNIEGRGPDHSPTKIKVSLLLQKRFVSERKYLQGAKNISSFIISLHRMNGHITVSWIGSCRHFLCARSQPLYLDLMWTYARAFRSYGPLIRAFHFRPMVEIHVSQSTQSDCKKFPDLQDEVRGNWVD